MIFPAKEIIKKTHIKDYETLYQKSIEDPESFWENIARKLLWFKPWDKVLEWKYPYARWFLGGQTNIIYNALDRWQKTEVAKKLALIWVGQPDKQTPENFPVRTFTYKELNEEVCRLANGLKSLGVKKGDRVIIYLPRIPEQFISMLACLKIGALHSVVYSGFSTEALKSRIEDAQAKVVITTNWYPYKDKVLKPIENVVEAVKEIKSVEYVIVVERKKSEARSTKSETNSNTVSNFEFRISDLKIKFLSYHDLLSKQDTLCSTAILESTDPSFILYTSGCCHKDTLIQLSNGKITRIEDLVKQKGTSVINFNLNQFKQENDKITEKHYYNKEPFLLLIKTPIASGLFTPNHPFFVITDKGEIIEKTANCLKVGEQIMMSRKIDFKGKPQKMPDSKNILYYEKKARNFPNKPLLPKIITPYFAQLLGYFTGDGSLKEGAVEITDQDKNNLIFYQKLIKKLNLRSKIVKYDRQRLIIFSRFFSCYLKKYFNEVFAQSHLRDIPVLIQKSEKKIVASFIRGLYDAEGSVVNSSIKIVSTSQFLIQKLQMLFLRFGIVSSYNFTIRTTYFKEKKYSIPVYELKITDRESLITFAKEINFSSQKKHKKLKKLISSLSKKRVASMIFFLPINGLVKELTQTLRLNKKELRKFFLDSYLYTKRRTTLQHLPQITKYLTQIIKKVESLDFNSLLSIRKAIFIFRITQKTLAQISGKAENTVHKYLHSNKAQVSQKTLNSFYEKIIPFLKKTKQEKIEKLSNILFRIKTLQNLKNIGFFEIKKITIEKNDHEFESVFDLTTKNNHNYIANGFVVHNSTGKPKGVLHSHGGYMVGVYATMKYVFDIHGDEIFWSTADAGWITGHSYILYGPLLNGITTFVYEGTPDFPDIEVWWKLIDRFKITHFYTAPTAIRALMRFGEEPLKKYSLSSLRILGSVGEPINPEAWQWFYKNVGREKLPIMDTWWQTETGMHILTPLPCVPLKPGSCFKPFFGVVADVVNEEGKSLPKNTQGYLVIKTPWPAMLLDLWGNPKKYKETYFEKIKSEARSTKSETNSNTVSNFEFRISDFCYFTGDSAKIDEDGYFWIVGRNDDVIKVSGHRLGSAEIEHAIVEHPAVAEAAVIGKPHEVKGESIKAFIILKIGQTPSEELKKEINNLVRKQIGPIASIDEIEFVDKLPKTRSGKIMRRVLKAKELDLPVGDLSTLEE